MTRRTTSDAHDEAAWFGLTREIRDLPVIARFAVDGEPQSKARPRVGRRGTYTPDRTVAAEQRIAWAFRQAARSYTPNPNTFYGLTALFFAATRQRRDVDNMLKLIADGLNGVAWVDDSHILEVSARKSFVDNPDQARTEILVYEVRPDTPPQGECAHCGEPFQTYNSWASKRKYCSPECRQAAVAQRRTKPCRHCATDFVARKGQTYCSDTCRLAATGIELQCVECGATFRRARSVAAQQHDLCSDECRTAYWRKHRASAARGVCADCGGPTSKKSYRRCRACSTRARRDDQESTS